MAKQKGPKKSSAAVPAPTENTCKISALIFDPKNPRFAGKTFTKDDEIIKYLYDDMDVDEVIRSILSSGYSNFEPMIVLPEGKNFIVLEGNRRLAALRIISDEALRTRLKIALPEIADPKPLPDEIRVWSVTDRTQARAYIGFKHINGPFRWDAYAKAQYAADWLETGADIVEISRTLGDTHNTVRRLVNGYYALKQAEGAGFDRAKGSAKRFAFSHLYTALTRTGYREFLGLGDEDLDKTPGQNPIPKEKVKQLSTVMSWLYGQGEDHALIRSQNPDLNRLNEVLSNPEAKKMLLAERNLENAYERVVPPITRFEDSLLLTSRHSEESLKLVGHYNGDPGMLKVAESIQNNAKSLVLVMKVKADEKSK